VAATRRFLLDADVLIQAHRSYYAFDICPGFWDCLVAYHGQGRVQSIDRVHDEIAGSGDSLEQWTEERVPSAFFGHTKAQDVLAQFGEIQAWVDSSKQFTDAAKEKFRDDADGWLVAYAKTRGWIVVTREKFEQDIKHNVKIPNICRAFDVECIDTFKMLRELGARFVLPKGA
jgi:hypothetical protein